MVTSSTSVPCFQAYVLAFLSVAFACVSFLIGLITFTFYTSFLHRNPNHKFVNTTKFDVESSSWVLVLSSAGAAAGALSVVVNYHCGATCPAETLSCNTLSGQYGAAFVASFSAATAAALKLASFIYQVRHIHNSGLEKKITSAHC